MGEAELLTDQSSMVVEGVKLRPGMPSEERKSKINLKKVQCFFKTFPKQTEKGIAFLLHFSTPNLANLSAPGMLLGCSNQLSSFMTLLSRPPPWCLVSAAELPGCGSREQSIIASPRSGKTWSEEPSQMIETKKNHQLHIYIYMKVSSTGGTPLKIH